MTQAIGARRDGDAFQARLFWLKAAYLLDDESPIARVGFESGPKSFDDIWVEYDPAHLPKDQYGQPLTKEYFQCKWHVTAGLYTHKDLVKPEFINATSKSLLQRAHEALTAHRDQSGGLRFKLVTNWRVDPGDRLSGLIRNRSHTLKVDELFDGTTDKSAAGQIRKLWCEHLQIDESELRRLASTLGFSQFVESLEELRERLDLTCRAFGLRCVPAESSAVIYDDTIRQWASQGRTVFDRKEFRKACEQDKLLDGRITHSVVFGVKSFEHPIDRLEDRCADVLNLIQEFDDRFIRDSTAWRTKLLPALQSFLTETARSGERLRLAIDAHTTLAFAAGAVLNTKSGRTVEIEQRSPSRVVWAPDDSEPQTSWPEWQVALYDLPGAASEIAVAVCLTHDVEPNVRAFLEAQSQPIRSLLVLKPTGGPSSCAVLSGAHAYRLAESLAAKLKLHREAHSGGRDARVHLFIAAPNGFSFYLGRQVHSLKPLTLYEFDFENQRSGSYTASLSIPDVEPCEPEAARLDEGRSVGALVP